MERVAGLLLAAGGGQRVGVPKALLRRGDELLVERAVGVLREAGCAPIIVVLGAGADQVRAEADLAGVTIVVNQDWATGLGSSLRAGLQALSATAAEATIALLVDTPGVTAQAVRRIAALPYPDVLVCATYAGRRGHPMLLGRAHWSGIAALAQGDVGARPYLLSQPSAVVEVGCDGISSDDDVDTLEAAATWDLTVPSGPVRARGEADGDSPRPPAPSGAHTRPHLRVVPNPAPEEPTGEPGGPAPSGVEPGRQPDSDASTSPAQATNPGPLSRPGPPGGRPLILLRNEHVDQEPGWRAGTGRNQRIEPDNVRQIPVGGGQHANSAAGGVEQAIPLPRRPRD